MDPSAQTVFRFSADGVEIEFAGTEAFVEQQLERFRHFLQGAVGAGAGPAPTAPAAAAAADAGGGAAAAPTKESLASFYAARPLREGRGAIQDRILLFIHYLHTAQGKREVSGDDILWCFQQLGLEQPKNLHNALGILKRKLGHLAEGSRRGLYQLSPEGRQYVEGRFS
jgi:hypothetical protein